MLEKLKGVVKLRLQSTYILFDQLTSFTFQQITPITF